TATAATLTLAGLTPADTGAYTVTAQNPLGTATSAPAQLTIAASEPPPPSPAPAGNTSGGGGGGASSPLCLLALVMLLFIRRR
ncbi:MAG: immunoglobulin domain-containing protein, partial [Opitutaceae bacterium]|nr:immunoglobulin domain-containing protein [Opitutaceae bacterium]